MHCAMRLSRVREWLLSVAYNKQSYQVVDEDAKRVVAQNRISSAEVQKKAEDASRLFAHMDSHRIDFPVCFILFFELANVCFVSILFTRVGGVSLSHTVRRRNTPSLPR